MITDWREQLRKLQELVAGTSGKTASSKGPLAPQFSLSINLGIDFGTSFTKVCFRDVGTEETGIVTFGARAVENAILPSVVSIDERGNLSVGYSKAANNSTTAVRYLKMRLAEMNFDEPWVLDGIDLNEPLTVRALTSWYLATVISRSQEWIIKQEAARTKGRKVQWSANVGVPVEHYDSPCIETFRRVLAVGWTWVCEKSIPGTLVEGISSYQKTTDRIAVGNIDCHPIPEIAAAVQSFIISREAHPGVYVYFDIGGGTADGVVFKYINEKGARSIDFYSAKVELLGSAVIANQSESQNPDLIEKAILGNDLSNETIVHLEESSKNLQRQVSFVIMTAKQKDSRNWYYEFFQDRSRLHNTLARLDVSTGMPLIIFLGGGGAGSTWYQNSILATHWKFSHWNFRIPPYDLAEVPKPSDLHMYGLELADFRRFAIAYGLSVPYGEGPDIRLPSQFPKEPPRQLHRMKSIVDYHDTKDAYC